MWSFPFVPKPHTAYQWYGQISLSEIERRVKFVSSQLKTRGIKVNWHDPLKSFVEGALARSDARIGKVIEYVWKNGGRFDEWGECFSYQLWEDGFRSEGLSLLDYAEKTYTYEDILPWDPISIRVSKRYLWREWEKTFRDKESRHCGNEMCRVCKVCDGEDIVTIHADSISAPKSRYNMEHDLMNDLIEMEHQVEHVAELEPVPDKNSRYRLQFGKTGNLIYASHHDLMQMVETIFRRAGLKMAYSEGFSPKPKIVFASALPVGTEAHSDYLEITTLAKYEEESLLAHINEFCPDGFRILEIAGGGKQQETHRSGGCI